MKKVTPFLLTAVFLLVACAPGTPAPLQAIEGEPIIIPFGEWDLRCLDGSTPDGTSAHVICLEPTPTPTATFTPTASPTFTVTPSPVGPTATNTPQTVVIAYPNAPLCPDHTSEHVTNHFHTLWDSARGCHYDHEHGVSPFTAEVAATFPGFDFFQLLCGNGVSHCNPSSPTENVHKHGGHKWQVDVTAPKGCAVGFEGGTVAVDAYAIQWHAHGRQDIEHEVRNHSSVAFLRQCKASNPSDKGYIFVGQLQEYGQRITPYQGYILPYPDQFLPTWFTERGQYFTTECQGANIPMPSGMSDLGITTAICRQPGDTTSNNLTVWTSKITGTNNLALRPPGSNLFTSLFRGRDNYQRLQSNDLVHPFTWRWVCGGTSFNPVNCRFNSSTMTIHEIAGTIPAYWDNQPGWDTDSRVGRITAQGYVTRFGNRDGDMNGDGDLNDVGIDRAPVCTPQNAQGNLDCQPIKLVSAFVGKYSTDLCDPDKCSNPNPRNTPERDIYFCNGVPCLEYLPTGQINPAAVPSGWISSEN